jgi:ferredoxin-NADP reductase
MTIGTQTPAPAAALPSQLMLEVVAKEAVADGVVALTLADPSGKRLPDWTPGSHIDLILPTGHTRQYSLCGDRWDPSTYRVGILNERDGRGGSAFVHREITPGSLVAVGGPRNHFRLVPAREYVFIAGGIGITAIIPMIRSAARLGADWQLLYLGRSRRTMAFLDELEQYGDSVTLLPKDEHGRADLPALIGGPRPDAKVYVCGPERMLEAIEAHCSDWPEGSLRTEHFAAKDQGEPSRKEAFEVRLARTGTAVTVQPGVSILDAIQGAGASLLSSCRTGTCGTCEVTVLEGVPDHRDSILTPAERATGTSMFPCVSRSCTDRLVLDL